MHDDMRNDLCAVRVQVTPAEHVLDECVQIGEGERNWELNDAIYICEVYELES